MQAATKILREEHDTILQMLQTLETIARKTESGEPMSFQTLADVDEFFSLFADKSHHGKEEDLLFPLLERKGVPRAGGPVGCMLTEHDEGRAFMKAMRRSAESCASGIPEARHAWAQAARGYANLLRNHIWKENEILFQIAERLLTAEEQAALAAAFASSDEARIDQQTQERLRQLLSKFAQETSASAR